MSPITNLISSLLGVMHLTGLSLGFLMGFPDRLTIIRCSLQQSYAIIKDNLLTYWEMWSPSVQCCSGCVL